jgi:hypothetical protein
MSELFDMMRDIPPLLAAAWGGWMSVGLLLLLWQIRARPAEVEYAHQRLMARQPRPKSNPRPPSGIRRQPVKTASSDAFGELEALLEPAQDSGPLSRRPGD